MREIKFRAWDKKKKEMHDLITWHHPNYLDLVCYATGQSSGDVHELRQDNNCIIMQFTGLFDKQRKEIYEGDIFDSPSKNKFYVKWWKDGWYYNNVKDEEEHVSGRLLEIAEDWEVIGNIYENLELLKKRTKK